MRMIDQGGVRLNGEKISDKSLSLAKGQQFVVQVGKRKFARVNLI
jgi:tyrosyl-tRNA synthetase